MDIRKAHTSEHIFMGALTKIRDDIRVRKVEHKINVNEVYIEAQSLSWDDIIRASFITNMVILDNRRVLIEYYDSIDEAMVKYPGLRAFEERITPPVRVVVIEGFDYAACKMPHLSRTGDAYLFIPVSLNKAKKNRYVLRFLVDTSAISYAVESARLIDEASNKLSTDFYRFLNALDNLLEKNLSLSRRVRALSRHLFNEAPEYALAGYRVKFLVAPGLDMNEVGRLTGEWIKNNSGFVIAVSLSDGTNSLLLAGSRDIDLDLRDLANELFSYFGGKGGGRRDWVMGVINRVDGILSFILDKVNKYG